MTYVSSQSLSYTLRQSIMQAQSALTTAQTEVSTGKYADLGLTLGAQTGVSLSLKNQVDQLTTMTSSNDFAITRLSTTSTALDSLISSAQGISQALVGASSAGGTTSSLSGSAQAALQGLISSLNSAAGGQYVFGGINTSASPIANYYASGSSSKSAVDGAFQSAFSMSQTSSSASSISGAAMTTFLNGSFDSLFSASGWQTNWSSASDETLQSTIAPSQSANTSVSANQTAFRQIAEAYTMLNEFTGSNFSADAQAAVVSKATSLVNTALASLTNIQAGIGTTQNQITAANSAMSAQTTVLNTHIGDLENVDPYMLSTQITQLQTQLQSSYELTSQLHQLSLVNYLTTG